MEANNISTVTGHQMMQMVSGQSWKNDVPEIKHNYTEEKCTIPVKFSCTIMQARYLYRMLKTGVQFETIAKLKMLDSWTLLTCHLTEGFI